MMVACVVTRLGVGMHGGGKNDDRGDRQDMSHFTLRSLMESCRDDRKSRSSRSEIKSGKFR